MELRTVCGLFCTADNFRGKTFVATKARLNRKGSTKAGVELQRLAEFVPWIVSDPELWDSPMQSRAAVYT